MGLTRHLNVKADNEDFAKIHENANASNKTMSEFLRELGLKFTPEVQSWFWPVYQQYIDGKLKEKFASDFHEKYSKVLSGFEVAQTRMDKFISDFDSKQHELNKLFETLKQNAKKNV
jgi:hypothetical protein